MFKEYISYYKNNPEGYWFKRKLYGWGWTPVRWQGWVTMLIFVALIVLNAFRIDSGTHSQEVPVNFILETLVLVVFLVFVCYLKGEKPRWQWGIPKE